MHYQQGIKTNPKTNSMRRNPNKAIQAPKQQIKKEKKRNSEENYPSCNHCGKMGHPLFKCWKRLDAKCSQCNQLRHEIVICKNKIQQHNEEAKATDQEEEDHLFVGTCFSSEVSNENWLIDSGCTNHVTYNKGLFKELNKTITTKVRVGNGAFIIVLGKGTVAIPTCLGTKLLHDVLYV